MDAIDRSKTVEPDERYDIVNYGIKQCSLSGAEPAVTDYALDSSPPSPLFSSERVSSDRKAASKQSSIRHSGPISGIDARGGVVATAGYDNRVLVWDAVGGIALASAMHDHLANQCRFSHDGRLLVTSSSDHTARLWRASDLRLLAVLDGHEDDVEMSVFSPDDRLIATASRDRRLRVFERNGRLVMTMTGHEDDVNSVDWLDDDTLLSCSDDGTVRTWSVSSGRLLATISTGELQADTVVPGAGVIYAGNDAGEIVVIDRSTGAIRETVAAHASGVKRLVIHSASGLLSSTSYDRLLKVWRTAEGTLEPVASTEMPAIVWPRATAWLNATTIVCGTFGTTYASYDLAKDRWHVEDVAGTGGINAVLPHDGAIYTVGDAGVVARDGVPIAGTGSLCNFLCAWDDLIVTGGQSGSVFDARSGNVLFEHNVPLNYATKCGDRLLVATYGGELLVLLRRDGAVALEQIVQAHRHAVKSVVSNGTHVFSVAADTSVAMRDARTLALVVEFRHGHTKIANGAAALPDGRFASVSRDRILRLWTPSGSTEIATPHQRSIKCVAVSHDGRSIATGAYDGRIAVYDLAAERWTVTRPTISGISSITPFHDGFIASSYDGRTYEAGA